MYFTTYYRGKLFLVALSAVLQAVWSLRKLLHRVYAAAVNETVELGVSTQSTKNTNCAMELSGHVIVKLTAALLYT